MVRANQLTKKNITLQKALNKAKMSNRRKNLSEENKQVEREKNKIEQQRHRSRLLEEERQEQRDRHRKNKQEYRNQLSQDQKEEQREKNKINMQRHRRNDTNSLIQSNFNNITHDDLIEIEKEWIEDNLKCNVSKNLQDAILCYYLNSGYARFNEHLSFSNNYNGKEINVESIINEIDSEVLSDKELYS